MEENYRIIFNKKLGLHNVRIEEVVSSRLIDNELEQKCKEKWQEMLTEAETLGKKLWDSEVYRFESIHQNGDDLLIRISTMPFSVRLGMNLLTKEVEALGPMYAAMGMFASCFVMTSDGKYVFIEKSDKYFTKKKLSFIGGVASKTEKMLSNAKDLFEFISSEIVEEIGADVSHIKDIALHSGYITGNFNFCLLFKARLTESFSDIQESFLKNNDGEASRLLGVDPLELDDFIKKMEKKDQVKFAIINS